MGVRRIVSEDTPMTQQSLGQRFYDWRHVNGRRRSQVADELGIDESLIARIEHDIVDFFDTSTIRVAIEALIAPPADWAALTTPPKTTNPEPPLTTEEQTIVAFVVDGVRNGYAVRITKESTDAARVAELLAALKQVKAWMQQRGHDYVEFAAEYEVVCAAITNAEAADD